MPKCTLPTDLAILHENCHIDQSDDTSTNQETAKHQGGAATQQNTQPTDSLINILTNSLTNFIEDILTVTLY
jgi:hypothetical protein